MKWQFATDWQPTVGVEASYASGDDGDTTGTLHRFDPILPDVRSGLGKMGLYGWSNVMDAAALFSVAPVDELPCSWPTIVTCGSLTSMALGTRPSSRLSRRVRPIRAAASDTRST